MKIIIIAVALLALTGFAFSDQINLWLSPSQTDKKGKKEKKGRKDTLSKKYYRSDITIKQKWDLPAELVEVSGIAFIDNIRFACVQDEEGTIYIYNTATGTIEKKIPFSGAGDFEGLTLMGKTAYVVRADGILYEVDLATNKSNNYNTGLNFNNNIEGLCYDKTGNRLLLVGKGPDLQYDGYKAIYAFDLTSKKMNKDPLYKIALSDKQLINGTQNSAVMPSAIGVHPLTNDIYLTDASRSILVQLNRSSLIKNVYDLGKEFAKPEGITFSPQGDLFISNEGKKQAGNIIEVILP